MLEKFKEYLLKDNKSANSIKNYSLHVSEFLKWYSESFDLEFIKLYRKNVLEYKSYLKNVKENGAKSINVKLSSIMKFNEFLQGEGIQEDIVLSKKDFLKIQKEIARPGKVEPSEIEKFIQNILLHETKRNYAMVMLMAYGGLRVSEVCNVKVKDLCLVSGYEEVVVTEGKGSKMRVVPLASKLVEAIADYKKERDNSKEKDSEYFFLSQKGGRVDRTVVNRIFTKYSDVITPHELRHFFCTNALEKGLGIHEVATIAGHSNIHTTLMYTNPSRQKMREKIELL